MSFRQNLFPGISKFGSDLVSPTVILIPTIFRIDATNERAILNHEISIFEQIWKSVSHGEETVKDHLKYELGIPLGLDFGMKTFPVFKVWILFNSLKYQKAYIYLLIWFYQERYRQLLLSHQEFRILPDHLQSSIANGKTGLGLALVSAKLESATSGFHQLKLAYGEFDEKSFSTEVTRLSCVSLQSFKKITLSMMNQATPMVPKEFEAKYNQLCSNMGKLIQK